MRKTLVAAALMLFSLGAPAHAHRLDEYLQATLISVEPDHIHASIRLVPGVAVFPSVLASMDTDADGVISAAEQRAYAERVLGDIALTVDGTRVKPLLVSVAFPEIEWLKEGLGEIAIGFTADVPRGGPDRRLVFENHHQSHIAVYLVNCLVPRDPRIQIIAQDRNEQQSFYQLDYRQGGGDSASTHSSWWSGMDVRGSIRISFRGFAGMFHLGMRHIAEGTDHLLFLLTLLLPAPLLVLGSRWAGFAGVRQGLLQTLRVVTAFTVGHSVTLALAALGAVHVPSRPIEVLVAISILASAAHALRPLFPGREAGISAFFGLIHGLAFASTPGQLGLGWWQRVSSLFGFNAGIETMQLVVVGAAMPSLVLLSRTRAYAALRIGGALFAGFASAGWLAERLLDVHTSVDVVVNSVAHRAVWIAAALCVVSLVCWSFPHGFGRRRPPERTQGKPSHALEVNRADSA